MKNVKEFDFSMITHDLKSPMIGIMGLSRLMTKEMETENANPKWIEFSQRIQNSGEEIMSLIKDILTMGKIAAGEEKVEPYPVENLKEQMLSILSTFELEANTKRISLKLKTEEPLGYVFWDILKIRLHVINNLISNALKFTQEGGEVTITVLRRNEVVRITIEDTGPGIPKDDLENIFRPFGQGATNPGRIREGAGLGLSNARLFTEKHGGSIVAQNRENAGGARFVISLPADASSAHPVKDASLSDTKREITDEKNQEVIL